MNTRAGKRYFQHTKLADIIDAYPYKNGLSDLQQLEQRKAREAFLDFLWGILVCTHASQFHPLFPLF